MVMGGMCMKWGGLVGVHKVGGVKIENFIGGQFCLPNW